MEERLQYEIRLSQMNRCLYKIALCGYKVQFQKVLHCSFHFEQLINEVFSNHPIELVIQNRLIKGDRRILAWCGVITDQYVYMINNTQHLYVAYFGI